MFAEGEEGRVDGKRVQGEEGERMQVPPAVPYIVARPRDKNLNNKK